MSQKTRRWLQFSLRTFVVALTILGVWLGLHVRSVRKQRESVAAIKRLGGWSYYDFQNYDPYTRTFDVQTTSWVPTWLLRHLGEDFFHDIAAVNLAYSATSGNRLDEALTDEALAYLEGLPHVVSLLLCRGQATDAGMKHVGRLKDIELLLIWDAPSLTDAGVSHLAGLSKLRVVRISETGRIGDESLRVLGRLPLLETLSIQYNRVTDAGLAHLQHSTSLKRLHFGMGNEITDVGLVYLAGLTRLEALDLQDSQVTNAGLAHLKGLSALQSLSLGGTKVDDTSALQEALPNCKIR